MPQISARYSHRNVSTKHQCFLFHFLFNFFGLLPSLLKRYVFQCSYKITICQLNGSSLLLLASAIEQCSRDTEVKMETIRENKWAKTVVHCRVMSEILMLGIEKRALQRLLYHYLKGNKCTKHCLIIFKRLKCVLN